MLSGGDGDRHCEHFRVSQTNKAEKKKSDRRPTDPEDIPGSIYSAPERISHDTHLFVVPFGTADPRQYCPNYHRPVGVSSIHRNCLHVTTRTYLYRLFVDHEPYHVSPSSTAAPSATPDVAMPALAPGQKDRLGRVMIELDGSSWHPAKDAARALKDCVRRLYTHAYHFWSEILNSIRQAIFNEFKNTEKFKAISEQAKKSRGSFKGGSLHTRGAKTVGTITREMEKELGRTPIEPEVFKKTRVKKKENESDPDVWVEERAERTFQIKEQVLNLARRPTTSAPEDTDDDSDEKDDFVDVTP
ncbi:hypothetical protein MTR67_031264 [Solanum verrucosum]|uniref:Uncharacterized protein n=1 Tax=Solanum verrucosum TaxID=315347 RepID=A0AAF0ZHD2_SOLVR|nr:hypothetical protein MTR67_031264 [Solanum verrucosum]